MTTPVTDRPLTAEDVALLREGDRLSLCYGDGEIMLFRAFRRGKLEVFCEHHQASETWPVDSFTFVSRPPSVSADPVGGVTSDAGPAAEFWANVETGASEGGVTSGAGEVWRPMSEAPQDCIIIAMCRYPSATAGSPSFVSWDGTDGWEYSRNAPEKMVCWAWKPREVLGEWPSEGSLDKAATDFDDLETQLAEIEASPEYAYELRIAELEHRLAALTPSPPVQLSEREREAVDDVKGRIATWDGHDAGSVQVGVSVETLRTILAALTRTTGEG